VPKFNPNRWTPADDSSLGFRTVDPTRVVLNTLRTDDRDGCPCGCCTMPVGAGALFSMGHDATFRGKMIRAHLMDKEIRVIYNGREDQFEILTAMKLATLFGQQEHLKIAEARRDAANRTVAKRSQDRDDCLQLARWKYTGQVVAFYPTANPNRLTAEYVDRAGEIRRTRIDAIGINLVTT
jgi:hypothetical protein